ncbi:hypothetical protein [Comamonas endophytica]|uniref:Uncharacterized protein n=1 Tax=Comamonas endophytica TaxID=2949090 RepID=A0ABY6GE65_9BURK|nr:MULTISPECIES: hypothetical protein [unclassified Acidovorax]MCD2513256.1 hypothetical protein [Acidovorax sp. D4N7]UYG53401.1 hypothetical protein M9799_18680 [Acidovorax sp. 5MLIR]
MKALKSPLAKSLLANPESREQLRRVTVEATSAKASRSVVTVREAKSSTVKRYVATIVPKAA